MGKKNLLLMVNQRSMKKIDYFLFSGKGSQCINYSNGQEEEKDSVVSSP